MQNWGWDWVARHDLGNRERKTHKELRNNNSRKGINCAWTSADKVLLGVKQKEKSPQQINQIIISKIWTVVDSDPLLKKNYKYYTHTVPTMLELLNMEPIL